MSKKRSSGPPKPIDELEELVSIIFDFDFVQRSCEMLSGIRAVAATNDPVIAQALWMGSVVMYARCFNTGTRPSLPTSILDELAPEHRETHARTQIERDKYVAHVVATREEISAIERVVRAETGEVLGRQISFRRFTHDPDHSTALRELVIALRPIIKRRLDPLMAAVDPDGGLAEVIVTRLAEGGHEEAPTSGQGEGASRA